VKNVLLVIGEIIMGITSIGYKQLMDVSRSEFVGLNGLKMMELGNQFLYLNPDSGIPHSSVAKYHFEKLGVRHVSIDLNGQDGALVYDLGTKILSHEWENSFDIVTDFGTIEHVYNVYEAFRNTHYFCREGGIMMHVLPMTMNWPGHGVSYFASETFSVLAQLIGYSVLLLTEDAAMGNYDNGWQVHCIFKKGNNKAFINSDEWRKSIPIYSE
jgi:hypothetical protein